MGTQDVGMMATRMPTVMAGMPSSRRNTFRRLFVWYCAGIVGATFALTCVVEILLIIWYEAAGRTAVAISDPSANNLFVLLAFAVPFVVLTAAILFFAWRMGRKVSQPVDELLRAVEKIRQQDLDFTITYRARNELGDLCGAFDELRRELRESLEREWRKQEEMRTMVAALSHDLRTPVTIIQGHVEGLARTEAGERRNERLERYLPVLEASAERMTRLLNDMLLVAALEQTSFVIQPQPVLLEQELARRAEVYTLQAAATGVGFRYSFQNPAEDSSPVLLDLHRIEQVLDNLFENALRHTPANGEICLACSRDPRSMVFVLRDTGSGIAPHDLPHVWEKFYRGQPSPGGTSSQASGLGLSICKLLVERHGGTIALRNRPEGGCEAIVYLPATGA